MRRPSAAASRFCPLDVLGFNSCQVWLNTALYKLRTAELDQACLHHLMADAQSSRTAATYLPKDCDTLLPCFAFTMLGATCRIALP